MARFYGTGTGANRGYWALQWRDGKGRWIEMGSIGRYVIDGVTYTGRMVGGDSADSINMERRTANGKIVENTIDKISPKDFENLNVKALLDAPDGFSEEEVAQARRAENTRPKAASYPNGTKLTIDGNEHTKNDSDTWVDPSGETVNNADIDSRMDSSMESSADIPEEAELTQENILNATDGSQLTWNNKQYSRLDGKWYDERTGKPVSDKTMGKKTDGDLSTEGGKDSFTPTPASEYEAGTKLRAEMNEGQSTAELEKTGDNSWDIETDSNSTETDDATADKVIEAADSLDDLSDFLQNPEESGDNSSNLSLPQVEAEMDRLDNSDISDEEWGRELDKLDENLDSLRGQDGNPDADIDRLKADIEDSRRLIESRAASSEEEEEETPEPTSEPEDADDVPLEDVVTNATDDLYRATTADQADEALQELTDARNEVENSDIPTEQKNDLLGKIDDILLIAEETPDSSKVPAKAKAKNDIDRADEALRTYQGDPDDEDYLRGISRDLKRTKADLDESDHEEVDAAISRIDSALSPETEEQTETETDNSVNEDVRNTLDKIYDWDDYLGQALNRQEDDPSEENLREVVEHAENIRAELDRIQKLKDDGEITDPELSEELGRANDGTRNPRGEGALPSDINRRLMRATSVAQDAEDSRQTEPEDTESQDNVSSTDDIISDLDSNGSSAMDAISNGSDEELEQARTDLLNSYQEAQRAIDAPETSNEDKVRLQSKVEEVDRAITAIDQAIESRNSNSSEWGEANAEEGVSEAEDRVLDDGTQLLVFRDDDDGKYYASMYPAGSDVDRGPEQGFETKEEARQAALDSHSNYTPEDAPETHSDEDLEDGYLDDPEEFDDEPSEADLEAMIRETQEAAENGTLDPENVDDSADFTPTEDIEIRRANAQALSGPQDGDISVTASGRRSEYLGGRWVPIEDDNAPAISNEAQKELNTSGPETILVGKAGTPQQEAPKGAGFNRHKIELGGPSAPDHVQITNEDGTQETFSKEKGRWYRRLDSQGNLSSQPTDKSMLHAKINDSRQVATKTNGAPISYYGEKDITPAPETAAEAPAPSTNKHGGLTPGADHVPATSKDKKAPLGSHITNRPAKDEPNKVLTQDGKRVGMTDSEGNAYYVGDRVIYTDRSNNVRSARITAISMRGKDKKPAFDLALDEHDPETPEGAPTFDEWYAMTQKEREAAGLNKVKYSKTKSVYQDGITRSGLRQASGEDRAAVQREFDETKEQGRVAGVNVADPVFLDDVSSDRVVRDGSTAIIGTTNKYGELFQRGEVVEYGPNGEVGTIVYIGEADDRIRIAPNGQSTLESVYHHVDTISHSNKPATYYDKNYDLDAQDRVARDRFNNELRVGDTVYRYGFPFTVKDIYPDGSKIRVVGQDWAGEQGSAGSLSASQLIDLGFDENAAAELGGAREHDFMPDHLQVFTGDPEGIRSIRTHDSHMMTLTRDSQGRVLDTQENRDALASRAIGSKSNTKLTNSALARYIAENGDSERYQREGIQPGDFIDSGLEQAAGDNLQQYVNLTFGTDMVIPDNSRMGGYNRFGQPESYIKKDNRWFIEGVEGDDGMSAQEFYQYRLNNGYVRNPKGNNALFDDSKLRLSYMGDADEYVVPKLGDKIKKTDDEKFTLMPPGSLVRFTDAQGNIITIRKATDGKWYRVSSTGAWSSNRGPVNYHDIAGTASYRGQYTRDTPAPPTLDTTSKEAKKQRVSRQSREVERNNERREKGGVDRIYGTHITAEDTFRKGVANTETVRDSRQTNERLAAERDALKKENEAAAERQTALEEELKRLREQLGMGDDGDAVTASMGNRIVATRKGTDQVLAVYNRVSDNVWEHVSAKGYRREFVLEAMPSTPGVTYKVEEHVA